MIHQAHIFQNSANFLLTYLMALPVTKTNCAGRTSIKKKKPSSKAPSLLPNFGQEILTMVPI